MSTWTCLRGISRVCIWNGQVLLLFSSLLLLFALSLVSLSFTLHSSIFNLNFASFHKWLNETKLAKEKQRRREEEKVEPVGPLFGLFGNSLNVNLGLASLTLRNKLSLLSCQSNVLLLLSHLEFSSWVLVLVSKVELKMTSRVDNEMKRLFDLLLQSCQLNICVLWKGQLKSGSFQRSFRATRIECAQVETERKDTKEAPTAPNWVCSRATSAQLESSGSWSMWKNFSEWSEILDWIYMVTPSQARSRNRRNNRTKLESRRTSRLQQVFVDTWSFPMEEC